MCLIHDQSTHYIYQNIMEAFNQSKMLSPVFMRHVGALFCTCIKEFYTDSKTIITTQKELFDWFNSSLNGDDLKLTSKLQYFKSIIDDLHSNGNVDSGTKMQILKLLKDLSKFNYSKLRRPPKVPRRKFLMKVIHLKFDLKLCSFKEFSDSIQTIDNCAIKYIAHINDSKIYVRDTNDVTIRNFLGELDVTIESNNLRDLRNTEISLKRLADAFNYRLVKKMPSSSPTHTNKATSAATASSFFATTTPTIKTNLKIGVVNLSLHNIPSLPLQSPTTSTPDDELMNSSNLLTKMKIKDDFLTSIDDTSIIEKHSNKLSSSYNMINCLL